MYQQLPSANTQIVTLSEKLLSTYLSRFGSGEFVTLVRSQVLDLLQSDGVSEEAVARRLNMSRSSLARRLREEGETYRSVFHDTQRSLAMQYLQDGDLPVSEIGFRLGFQDLSSFSRSFRRWTGQSPRGMAPAGDDRLRTARIAELLTAQAKSAPACPHRMRAKTHACSQAAWRIWMNFEHTDKTKALMARVQAFMDQHVYPNEKLYFHQLNSFGANRFQIPPVLEELKIKAHEAGLWNLFLPESMHGFGLTNLEYAPLAEIMGRIYWASEVFNCSAPRHRQHGGRRPLW